MRTSSSSYIRCVTTGLGLLFWLFLPNFASGQSTALNPDDDYGQGLAYYAIKQFDNAQAYLERVIEANPLYQDARQGAAYYWLGLAQERHGHVDLSHQTWENGLNVFEENGLYDVRLVNAYINSVFSKEREASYERAATLFLGLLESYTATNVADERKVIEYHLAQSLLAMPEDRYGDVIELGGNVMMDEYTFLPAAGEQVAIWWRSEDPLPATITNERVEEHLSRSVYAVQHYQHAPVRSALDDRGAIYVRFGPPTQFTSVDYTQSARALNLGANDLVDNAFWVYRRVDDFAYYIFTMKDGRYQISDTRDLIPPTLRPNGLAVSPRKSGAMLQALLEIHRELAIHPHFSSRYDDLADHIYGGPLVSNTLFSQQLVQRIHSEDEYNASQRAEYVPPSVTRLFDQVVDLQVDVVVARFLEPDGRTRTDIVWSHAPGTLEHHSDWRYDHPEFDTDRSLIRFAATHHSYDFKKDGRFTHEYEIFAASDDIGRQDVEVQSTSLYGPAESYHVRMQWNQHLMPVGIDREVIMTELPWKRSSSYAVDSLAVLSNDPSRLEMSDLLPAFATSAIDGPTTREEVQPYPFGVISPNAPIAIYFETYHLTFGEDNLTHYTVSYELSREDEGGLFRFRRDGEDRTRVETSYTGSSRTGKDYIWIDLADWEDAPDDGILSLTIRITDDTSGQSVERTTHFAVGN